MSKKDDKKKEDKKDDKKELKKITLSPTPKSYLRHIVGLDTGDRYKKKDANKKK